MNPCEINQTLSKAKSCFKCVNKSGRCGYHVENQQYEFADISPVALCPEAFHNVYYISLGLLFNAKYKEKRMTLKCPGTENYVVLKATFEKLNRRFRAFNRIKSVFQWAYPGQVYLYGRLVWKAVEVKGECPFGITEGAKFYINMGNIQLTKKLLFPMGQPHELCPAAFDNIFPTLPILHIENRYPYSDSPKDHIQCPDDNVNITFEVTKENQ